tara:strand:- start:9 stop:491 length:483 start_codon:yes stop_codon:yes gene_type:complete
MKSFFNELNKFDDKTEVIIVSSCGGHLAQALQFSESYIDYNYLFVMNDRTDLDHIMKNRTLFITHAERNLKQFLNIFEAFMIMMKLRPKVIFSLGAAPALVFCIIGKFFGVKTIFVESFSRVSTPSLTGRLIYYFADDFYIQWPKLKKFFPKAKDYGGLL